MQLRKGKKKQLSLVPSKKQMGIFINGRTQQKKIIDFYCSASCKIKELDIPRSMIINKMRFAKRVYIYKGINILMKSFFEIRLYQRSKSNVKPYPSL